MRVFVPLSVFSLYHTNPKKAISEKKFRLGIDKRRAEWYTTLSVVKNEQTQDIVFLQQKRKTITEQGKEAVFRRFFFGDRVSESEKSEPDEHFLPRGRT